jgi:plasmid stabilization system protein ParE
MKFAVRIAASALRDLDAISAWIAVDSPVNADRWLDEMERAVRSLDRFPRRNSVAPDAAGFRQEIRHLLVGEYRIIFRVAGSRATVLHVRHAARRPLRANRREQRSVRHHRAFAQDNARQSRQTSRALMKS